MSSDERAKISLLEKELDELVNKRDAFNNEQLRIYVEEVEKGNRYQKKRCPEEISNKIASIRTKIRYQKRKISGTSNKRYLEHREEILTEQKKLRAKAKLEKMKKPGKQS